MLSPHAPNNFKKYADYFGKIRRIVSAVAAGAPTPTVVIVVAPSPSTSGYTGPYDPSGPDRDCGDFSNWSDAQAFYEAAGGPASDRHDLDRDRDGIACETLR